METDDRYQREKEFSDASAERTLERVPDDLRLSNVGSFENLCADIHYLRSVPGFYGPIAGKNVLEMGCGNGWISLRFARSGAHVWACDISPKTVELARRYAEAADLDVTFETMVCEEMTYEDNFFDFVFMHMALHHCDIPATAGQINRVLKPGGKAVIVEDYAYHPLMNLYRTLTPGKHTKDEHPLDNDELNTFVSCFSSHDFEYSGLVNVFETSNNRLLARLKPAARWMDDFLQTHMKWTEKYSRIVIVNVVK